MNKNAVSEKMNKRIFAICLIVVGVIALINCIEKIVITYIPDNVWDQIAPWVSFVPGILLSLFIIIVGISLICKKKEELSSTETE